MLPQVAEWPETGYGAVNIIENIGFLPWSGTRPDHPARRKTSHVNGLDGGRRAAFILPSYGRPVSVRF